MKSELVTLLCKSRLQCSLRFILDCSGFARSSVEDEGKRTREPVEPDVMVSVEHGAPQGLSLESRILSPSCSPVALGLIIPQ